MVVGEQVSLFADGGRTIVRTLVAVEKGYLFVCKAEEFKAAIAEGREPKTIGFRAEYLIGED